MESIVDAYMCACLPCVSPVSYTRAYPDLVPRPPQVSLISLQPIASILTQMTCIIGVQLTAFFVVQQQPW